MQIGLWSKLRKMAVVQLRHPHGWVLDVDQQLVCPVIIDIKRLQDLTLLASLTVGDSHLLLARWLVSDLARGLMLILLFDGREWGEFVIHGGFHDTTSFGKLEILNFVDRREPTILNWGLFRPHAIKLVTVILLEVKVLLRWTCFLVKFQRLRLLLLVWRLLFRVLRLPLCRELGVILVLSWLLRRFSLL